MVLKDVVDANAPGTLPLGVSHDHVLHTAGPFQIFVNVLCLEKGQSWPWPDSVM